MPLPNPTHPDQAVQRNFRALDGRFPLGPQDLANDSVGSAQIAPDAVGSSEIATGAVGSDELAANAATLLHTTTPTTSGPTTTSTVDPFTAILPEMTITADFGGYPVLVSFTGTFSHSVTAFIRVALYDAGTEIAASRRTLLAGTSRNTLAMTWGYTPAAGSRTLAIRWNTSSGTATANDLTRQMTILELRA